MDRERAAHLILRLGVAFSFLYPPFAAIGDPFSWIGYFPQFVQALPVDTTLLLHAFGAAEVVIALWLISGWKVRYPAILAALMLLAIVAFNLNQFEVLFRDLSIAAAALAIALWPSTENRVDGN
ncbi:MAG: DoxX family membrane protein [bacterium]